MIRRTVMPIVWRMLDAYSRRLMLYVNRRMMREKLTRYAPLIRGKVLDVGCGDAPYRGCFGGVTYIGVNSLTYYGQGAPAGIRKATSVWMDSGVSLPFAGASLDGVLCFQVLSVIRNPEAFFTELARLLRPGGYLLLSTDFLYPKWDPVDVYRHTDGSLRALAAVAGLETITVESFGGWMTTAHCFVMRYVRDYPGRIGAAGNVLAKVWRFCVYLGWLTILPLLTVVGWLILMLETRRSGDFTFTVNLLFVGRKREENGIR